LKILTFSQCNAVWNWAYPMSLVAENLQKRGDEIFFLTCDREYSGFCMAQAASKVYFNSPPEAKKKICDLCVAQRDLISDELSLNKLFINSYITDADREFAREKANSATLDNYKDCIVDGLPAGRLAMYEVLIQSKKNSLNFSSSELSFYRENLYNVIKTIKGFSRTLDEIKPEVCFLEHTSYSYNRACQLLAARRNIGVYFSNPNTFNCAHSYELLVVAKDDPSFFIKRVKEAWKSAKEVPVAPDEASLITDHFISLMAAKGDVYSAAKTKEPWSIRKHYHVRDDQKILLAATSSYDELYAVDVVGGFAWDTSMRIFKDMSDWIEELIQFVKNRPDLFLIIRVHPREFIVDQHGEISSHAKQLTKLLKDLPSNVVVNWPKDKISLYDLFEETDLLLHAWSSAGLEMAFLGMPVITFCWNAMLSPRDLMYSAESKEEYFKNIDVALKDGWNFERIRQAYRWCGVMHLQTSVNLSESFGYNTLKKRNFFGRAFNKVVSFFDPLYRQKTIIRKRKANLSTAEPVKQMMVQNKAILVDFFKTDGSRAPQIEEEAISHEMKRLYRAVYGMGGQRPLGRTLQRRLWDAFVEP
jgi:hypothetical protein